MRFQIEDQYPEKWLSENEQEPPFPECERVPWKKGADYYGADYYIEVDNLEELLSLGARKNRNLFIDVKGRRIVLTEQIELE